MKTELEEEAVLKIQKQVRKFISKVTLEKQQRVSNKTGKKKKGNRRTGTNRAQVGGVARAALGMN